MQVRKCSTDAEVIECIKAMVRQNAGWYINPEFTNVSENELIVTLDKGNKIVEKRLIDIKFEVFIIDGVLDEITLESVIDFPFNEMDLHKSGEFEEVVAYINKERSRIPLATEYDDAKVYVRSVVPTVVFALANLHQGVCRHIWDTNNVIAELGVTGVEGMSYCY